MSESQSVEPRSLLQIGEQELAMYCCNGQSPSVFKFYPRSINADHENLRQQPASQVTLQPRERDET